MGTNQYHKKITLYHNSVCFKPLCNQSNIKYTHNCTTLLKDTMKRLAQLQINSLRLHAQEKFQQNDFKTAKRCFVEIVQQMQRFNQKPPTSILFNTAMCYFKFKNYERVEQYLIQVLKTDPFSALACYYLGVCYRLSEKDDSVAHPVENIPEVDFFQEAINCMRRRPSHQYVSKSMRISPFEVDIDSIHYEPLGLDKVLTVENCEQGKEIEDENEVDIGIFRLKDIHVAGLQDKAYLKRHKTIRKDDQKLVEVNNRISVSSGISEFLR